MALVALLGAAGCSGGGTTASDGSSPSVRRTDTTEAVTAVVGGEEAGASTTTSVVASEGGVSGMAPRPTVWVDTTPTTRPTEEGDPTPTAVPPAPAYTVPAAPGPAGPDDRATASAAAHRYTAGMLTGDAGQSWDGVVMSLEPVVTPAHRAELAGSGPEALGRTTRARVTSATQVQSGAWRCAAEVYDVTDIPPGSTPRPTYQVWDLTVVPGPDGWRVRAAFRVV